MSLTRKRVGPNLYDRCACWQWKAATSKDRIKCYRLKVHMAALKRASVRRTCTVDGCLEPGEANGGRPGWRSICAAHRKRRNRRMKVDAPVQRRPR